MLWKIVAASAQWCINKAHSIHSILETLQLEDFGIFRQTLISGSGASQEIALFGSLTSSSKWVGLGALGFRGRAKNCSLEWLNLNRTSAFVTVLQGMLNGQLPGTKIAFQFGGADT